ncbi:MAG: methyltransferase family protein [Candidatus Dormibacteria bacterium]
MVELATVPAGLPHAGLVGLVVFWALFSVWLGGEAWLQVRRDLPAEAPSFDLGSKNLIGTSVWVAAGAGLAASFLLPGLALGSGEELFLGVGLGLMLAGLIVRWWAVAKLGSAFTVTVGIQESQELLASGPYRLVRHPSYTGSLLTIIGIALCCANWLALLALLLPFTAYAYRIRVEEQALWARFGDDYLAYRSRTTRLVPWLF